MLKKINNPILKNILEWALAVVIALFVFWMLIGFVARPARVFGTSMESTYFDGDRVIVNRLTFRFREPVFGDIVAFPSVDNPSQNYIKRVVGLPGDTIDIRRGRITINGEVLDDIRFRDVHNVFAGNVHFPMTLGDDYYFVLGDNLPISEDSRLNTVGNVHIDNIIGRVNFRFFPFNRFGFVE
ncbi:MAG: signal peptidase I [Defluviitaleaceae bacterium]|nr:signal peptidase I [Defluviitaleaceae bacterium]